MNAKLVFAVSILILYSNVVMGRTWAQFYPEYAGEQESGIWYKQSFERIGTTSTIKCVFICLHDNNCISVYTEDGACVFGLISNSDSFEGEVVTPAANQIMKRKCKSSCTVLFYQF